jgi:hypothetical protein
MAGGPPPHGKLYKMKCTSVIGNAVAFENDDAHFDIDVPTDDLEYFTVGTEYTIDFRPVPVGR